MKILINCYACSPYRGSEPGMGWKFIQGLASYHELHVMVESQFEKDINKYYQENPEANSNIHFYFIKKNRHKLLRKIWPPSYYWYYRKWQKEAFLLAKTIVEKEQIEIVHQLNMVGYREPGYLWKLNKPFVWGPIGGLENTPWKLLPSMSFHGIIYYTCYNIINLWQMYTSRRVRLAMLHARVLIAATQQIKDKIKKVYNRESLIIPEVGYEKNVFLSFAERKNEDPIKICWSGLHIERKSLNLLIQALSTLDSSIYELHVIGNGPNTIKWKKLANKLKVRNIHWHGWIQRADALSLMSQCHLFCITSLSDLTSTVLLEALSCGLPVIALNHCGFQNVLHDECGRRIEIKSIKQVVSDFATTIQDLHDNEELRINLAKGALIRAKEYHWDKKIQQINHIYESLSI